MACCPRTSLENRLSEEAACVAGRTNVPFGGQIRDEILVHSQRHVWSGRMRRYVGDAVQVGRRFAALTPISVGPFQFTADFVKHLADDRQLLAKSIKGVGKPATFSSASVRSPT